MVNSFLPCTNGRPERFIKPPRQPSSSNTSLSSDMCNIVDLFGFYAKKVYQEGYLIRHNTGGLPTHLFVELEGSTLHLWNAGNSSGMLQPQFIQITDNTVIEHERQNDKHLFSLFFKEKKPPCRILFEALDSISLLRWMTAFYLSNFERQKLHQLFTLKLIIPHTATKKKKAGYLQVSRQGMQWKKYWVVISTKKRRLFSMKKHERKPHILFYETKKSKKPEFIVEQLSNAYAIYPESTNLIDKRSMLKLENNQESLWIMTQDIQCLKEYLLTIYDLFHLFGRPNQILMDSRDTQSLNYAEPQAKKKGLYLHVNDVISKIDLNLLSDLTIQDIFNVTLKNIIDGTHSLVHIPPQCESNRNTITIQEKDSQLSTSNSSLKETPFVRYAADSSDESENDNEEDEEYSEGDDIDSDSDNEPIGKKLQELKLKKSSSTIPKPEDIPTPIPERIVASTFKEFNLSTDFGNLLDIPLDKRKYSLPERILSSSVPKERCRSWQDEWRSDDSKTLDDSFNSMEPRYELTQQHTLFDQYFNQKLSAKEQVEYSKVTGEPLVQVSPKPKNTSQSGLVGLVPQNVRRTAKDIRRAQIDKFDRERLLLENQIMQQQLMIYNIYHNQSFNYPHNYPVSPLLFSTFPDSYSPVNHGSMRSLPQLYHYGSQGTLPYQYRRRSAKSLVSDECRTPSSFKKKSVQSNERALNYN